MDNPDYSDRNKYRNGRKILSANPNAFYSNDVYAMVYREVQSRGYSCLDDKYLILEEKTEEEPIKTSFKDKMKEKIKDASESFTSKKEVVEVKKELEKTKYSNTTLKKKLDGLQDLTVDFWYSQVKNHPAITPVQLQLVEDCYMSYKQNGKFDPPNFDNVEIDDILISQNKKIEEMADNV